MSSGGQQPSAPQTPFSPNYRERRSIQSRGPGNAYTQRPGQQPNPQQPAQQLPPPPQQGNMQYDGGGYSTPFGGYGGFFEQYRTPFSGYGGGFSQPFALPQNPYNPYGSQQFAQQPPPGMEVNPNYQPSNRLSQDVRLSDMEFRPIQGANPATGVMPSEPISDPNERTFSTQALIRSTKDGMSGYYTDGSMSRFVPDEPQARQIVGFGNPYGGYGAPYGGSPYMGMFGGLGSLFGGNGFQGMNQQAQAQQAALQNQRQFPQMAFSQNTVYPDGRVIY